MVDVEKPSPLSRRGLLIVSLPRNDVTLARAAMRGGADLLKVHANVHHRASGTHFGPLSEEMNRLESILELGVPTGLVPGEEEMPPREEMALLQSFAFLDAYVTRLPLYLFEAGVPIVPAVPHDYPVANLPFLRSLPGDWLEASIIPPDGYGRPPVAADLLALGRVGDAAGRKMIVPTQRAIEPNDLRRYFDLPSVWAIMIGAVVTGIDAAGIEKTTARFRDGLAGIFG